MSTDVVTGEDIRRLMNATWDAPRPDCCPPHLVHPKYATWEVADHGELVCCANLCGWAAVMVPPK